MRGPRGVSLRTRWLMLRAQLSLPTLLSQLDENRAISILAAVEGGTAILIVSLAAWLSGLPLLFPSLAPTAFILFTRPFSAAAAPRSVILGHMAGIASGFAAWGLMSWITASPVSLREPGLALCLSANIGFMITCLLLVRLSCPHAPACATAIIIATGAVTAWPDLLVMAGAVILVAMQAVCIHRLLGVHAPLWKTDALPIR